MKWYKRIKWKGWYFEILVKDKKRGWIGGAFWPILLVEDQKNDFKYDKIELETIEHEKIHFKQQFETLFIGFVILYAYWYITRGYKANPFEIEANLYESEPLIRKPYGWTYFIKRETK